MSLTSCSSYRLKTSFVQMIFRVTVYLWPLSREMLLLRLQNKVFVFQRWLLTATALATLCCAHLVQYVTATNAVSVYVQLSVFLPVCLHDVIVSVCLSVTHALSVHNHCELIRENRFVRLPPGRTKNVYGQLITALDSYILYLEDFLFKHIDIWLIIFHLVFVQVLFCQKYRETKTLSVFLFLSMPNSIKQSDILNPQEKLQSIN